MTPRGSAILRGGKMDKMERLNELTLRILETSYVVKNEEEAREMARRWLAL
jgi:hypothetical protein